MKKGSWPFILITVISIFIGCFIIFSMVYSPEIILTKENAFKTLEVKNGTFFTIELKTEPETGYAWVYDMTDEGPVKFVKKEFAETNIKSGKESIIRFIFRTVNEGDTTINMKYQKEFSEKSEPVQSFVYGIHVK